MADEITQFVYLIVVFITGIVPGQHSTCSACERTITGVYGDFNTSDIDVSEGEKCRYTVCANTVAASYLLIGFFEAPQNIPATIQQGVCSQQNENQPILTTCYGETKPCLTIVSSNCACVRSTKPTRTSYGAFCKRSQNTRVDRTY